MDSSWNKHEKNRRARPTDGIDGNADFCRVERRFTAGLARASQLASMVAKSRAARQVEVADLLAGMYIYEWERLSAFWGDRNAIEEFLQRICSISPQRWHHWIELYDQQRHQEEAEASSPWRRLLHRSKAAVSEASGSEEVLPNSSELEQVLAHAAEISPFRDDVGGQAIPVLTAEGVLLSMARNAESEIGRNLRGTGLDIPALERAARDPRRAPPR
jgi:hypothetical protein